VRFRLLPAFVALCVAVPSAAQTEYAADRVLYRVSGDDLRAVVDKMGHEVSGSVARKGRFSMSIRTPKGQPNYFIFGEKCLKRYAECASVIYTTGYSPKAGVTLDTVNELNNKHVAKVSLETVAPESYVVRVQRRVLTDEGVTMGSLRAELVMYLRELAQIRVDTHPSLKMRAAKAMLENPHR